ncbi:unnamed protein product [Linum trigynum]|uniref:Uncharacterized protein n=1 Tax=Linum trigynum TaxID=586398 RepID=A0AAV2DD82_9ROSI
MKKKSAERNKIWPAASQQQSLMKWPDLKHVLTRPPPTTSAAAWHHHRRLREAEEDQAQVKYYPPPTTPRHHHHYTMISRTSSTSDSSTTGSHNNQMMMSSREYWDARRVFLSSYSFTDKKKKADGGPAIVLATDVEWLKGKGKMWAEEVKAAAAGFARYVVREVRRRRVVVKGCRLTFALPSFVVVRMRCVTPWITTQPPPGVVSV